MRKKSTPTKPSKLNRLPLIGALVLISTLIGFGYYKYFARPAHINLVGTGSAQGPITGTFYMNDSVATPAQLDDAVREMSQTGMKTIIILASGYLDKSGNTYKELFYFDDPKNTTKDVMKSAAKYGMEIYIGLAARDNSKVKIDNGANLKDLSNDPGKMIDFSLRLAQRVTQTASQLGISSSIKGYYLDEMSPYSLSPNYPLVGYLSELSSRLKKQDPTKKLIIAPYVLDEVTPAQMQGYYENTYANTKIDIIAPQDSVGSRKVSTPAKSRDLYKALRDATAKYPGREAWADIESQREPTKDNLNYLPATITQLSEQIDAASPHVTKMVTWIYQHTMLSNPAFDNLYSWTNQYTPQNAAARKSLRNDYIAAYLTPPSKFSDVTKATTYIAGIKDLSNRAIISGYNNNNFGPKDILNRGQMAVIISNSFNIARKNNPTPSFTDVPTNYSFYSFIEGIVSANITSGCSVTPKKYCPNDPVTNAQIAVFSLKGWATKNSAIKTSVPTTQSYSDVPPSHWAYSHVEGLAKQGVYWYCEQSTKKFCPDSAVDRATASHIISTILNK